MLKAYLALPRHKQADLIGQIMAGVAVIFGTTLYFM